MIYADNNATTQPLPEVIERMAEIEREAWGNPSSIHAQGRKARGKIEKARQQLAEFLGAERHMVLFTSGGSESNNWVIFRAGKGSDCRKIVVSAVEHPSVLKAADQLRAEGQGVAYLRVDKHGLIDEEHYSELLAEKPCLVSIMGANNETGTKMPIRQLVERAHQHGALFHVDAAQCVGKVDVNFLECGADFMTISAHKFYGPKGVGALLVRERTQLDHLLFGGGQEYGMRPGTENVPSVCGMVEAIKQLGSSSYVSRVEGIKHIRDKFERTLVEEVSGVHVNGHPEQRLPNTSNIRIDGVEGSSLLMRLDLAGVCCSAGSACSSGSPKPPHVLQAMGLNEEQAKASLRFSFGIFNEENEAEQMVACIKQAVSTLRG